jgi:AraC-like DNA-binding protein
VTAHIRESLPYRRVTKEYIASILDTSPRTMQRRLSEWGLSFEQLIDDIRYTEAMRLLDETPHTISDIAALVGYSDAPHFVRAFKRWTGTTPISFRQIARQRRPMAPMNGAPA